MDRLIYTAMSGAKATMEQQATVSQNLANATTNGFRSQLNAFRAAPVVGDGYPTRTYVADWTSGWDFAEGPLKETGRSLDIAVHGPGWIAVQSADGSEAYTRDGGLKIDENGMLRTQTGYSVLGDDGPIAVPPNMRVTIAADGSVSAVPFDEPNAENVVGRIKLVNPDEKLLMRNDDTLFRLRTGQPADADADVRVVSGMVEGSNVNVVEAMVNMINLSRQFELHMKMIKTAETDAAKATQILSIG
jgi:flagellar basal-body rod protein FlgF